MFSKNVLELDCPRASATIEEGIRRIVLGDLKRKGAVIALSGGIDSSTVGALCARALGPERTFGLFLPEADSSDDSLRLGKALADQFRIPSETVNIRPVLEALGCYRRRDDAIRRVFPEYGPGWKSKIVLPGVSGGARLNIFSVVVQSPDGEIRKARAPLDVYLEVVAATNMKQRTRKLLEYFHAERLNFAATGTPNRLEYDQGFFVKGGDGLADVKPIAHLYKTQVYAMAAAIGVPSEILQRTPTTDTYSLPQTQEEFYFSLPYDQMDLCLYAHNNGVPAAEVAPVLRLTEAQVEAVFRDIESKRRTTAILHRKAVLVEDVPEIGVD